MANHLTHVEILTAAMDWLEHHEPVRNWQCMLEYDPAGKVCRACILGAAFVVMEKSKPPDKVCDAICRAHRELFPNRTLSEPFTMAEIRTLYRRSIEVVTSKKRRPRQDATAGGASRSGRTREHRGIGWVPNEGVPQTGTAASH
jgi:hypothetical protein